jgi:hypothetical protein
VKLRWYRFLDSFESFLRRKPKEIAGRKRWGPNWRDMTRPGRVYTRVAFSPIGFDHGEIDISKAPSLHAEHRIRPEPGWEWTCPNCKEYSIITQSMMPAILKEWQDTVQRMTYTAAAKGVKVKIPPKPSAATAGCTNCKYLPGSPE